MSPNPGSSPIIKHEENVIINSIIDRLQDMGLRFLGMGRAFLGQLFKVGVIYLLIEAWSLPLSGRMHYIPLSLLRGIFKDIRSLPNTLRNSYKCLTIINTLRCGRRNERPKWTNSIMSHLSMDLNWVNIWFHLGYLFLYEVGYISVMRIKRNWYLGSF